MKGLIALLALFGYGLAASEPQVAIGMSGDWPNRPAVISGRASFYGASFSGRKTASGENFHHEIISAASNRFPLGTVVAVRRTLSARCVVVRINDRMGHRSRLIDLSREAAVRLGMIDAGVTEVEIVALPRTLIGHEHACSLAFMSPVHLRAAEGMAADGMGK